MYIYIYIHTYIYIYIYIYRGLWLTDLFPRVAEADVGVGTVVVLALCLRDVLLRAFVDYM